MTPTPYEPAGPDAETATSRLVRIQNELDSIDDQMLALFEQRLEVAAQIGRTKSRSTACLPLRPDREQRLTRRHAQFREPAARDALTAIGRELTSWGVARQRPITLSIWSPLRSIAVTDAARRRFGGAPLISDAVSAEAALQAAVAEHTVAILALDAYTPWWIDFSRKWPELTVFEGLDHLGGLPCALAIGRIPPSARPGGPRVVDSTGGDAGPDEKRRSLLHWHGRTLALTSGQPPLGGHEGCIGAIAAL